MGSTAALAVSLLHLEQVAPGVEAPVFPPTAKRGTPVCKEPILDRGVWFGWGISCVNKEDKEKRDR